MQDFDALRHRVEETAERLSSAQSERQREIQSLIAVLGDLEEKYSAQEKQFAYYRARLEPLERTNAQLTSLIENLLDLIDRGFGESSLEPLRKASNMASVLLERDLPPVDRRAPAEDAAPEADIADAVAQTEPQPDADVSPEPVAEPAAAEPEMASLDDVTLDVEAETAEDSGDSSSEAAASDSVDAAEVAGDRENEADDVQVIQDLMELMDALDPTPDTEGQASQDEGAETAGSVDPDNGDEDADGVSDLELEEVPLSNLEDDIDMALDNYDVDLDAVASSGLSGLESDTDAVGDSAGAEAWDASARFEDVSDAVLDLELEEDAGNAAGDLPEVVRTAAAAFASDSAVEDVDTLAAIAEAMEKETESGQAAAPAHSDIRSLMLRVEALAKKAEAMRLAQSEETSGSSGASGADDSAATADNNPKKPEVAA